MRLRSKAAKRASRSSREKGVIGTSSALGRRTFASTFSAVYPLALEPAGKRFEVADVVAHRDARDGLHLGGDMRVVGPLGLLLDVGDVAFDQRRVESSWATWPSGLALS